MSSNNFLINSHRIVKNACSNVWRNKVLSFATVIMMAIILFIFNIIISLNLASNNAINFLNEKVDIILYIKDDIDPLKVTDLIQSLKNLPSVKETIYTSKQEALQEILADYPDQEDPFQKFGLENKLPANIRIVSYNPQNHDQIIDHIKIEGYNDILLDISDNRENQEIADRLINITNIIEKIMWSIVLAFLLGGGLIMINAIHLTIRSKRKEINIMKLVGANMYFIHLPFIIEGIIYGLTAFALNILLFSIFISRSQINEIGLNFLENKFLIIITIEVIATVLLSTISSQIAVNTYLRSK